MLVKTLCTLLLFTFPLVALSPRETLYNRLDPRSLAQAFAFYELYEESPEGKSALERACVLLHVPQVDGGVLLTPLFNRHAKEKIVALPPKCSMLLEQLASKLPNRALKGYCAISEEEVLALSAEEIDLGKALFLAQEQQEGGEGYLALLDAMALEVMTRFPQGARPKEKVKEINRYLFEEKRFRFPPHSRYVKEIDAYTFLPSVMDNHLGVCLGVTTLYLALAERVGLSLEIFTPPGHIFLSCIDGDERINIETTARGIHKPLEEYLGVNNLYLQKRTKKEVVGLNYINQASIFLHRGEYERAVKAYRKAALYVHDDPLLSELLGFALLFAGNEQEGRELLQKSLALPLPNVIFRETMTADFLAGRTNLNGIKAVFEEVDETRASILQKQKTLLTILKDYPHFRAGIEQTAICYLQLHRTKEALTYLNQYHALEPHDPSVEYYLAIIHAERQDYTHAWHHLLLATSLTPHARPLKELRSELSLLCPSCPGQ